MQHDAMQPGGRPHRLVVRWLVATGVTAAICLALAAQAHAPESPDTSSTGRLQTLFDGINIDKPGRPTIGAGNQGGGHDDVSGFSASSLVGVEPDVDADGMGDETQDPDGGGLGTDWLDDWFEDVEQPARS